MDVEIGGLRHHAPEQGYVEPVNGGIEMGFMSLSQLRGQYRVFSRFFDGGGLRFKGLCRGEFGDGFRLIFEKKYGYLQPARGAASANAFACSGVAPLVSQASASIPATCFVRTPILTPRS